MRYTHTHRRTSNIHTEDFLGDNLNTKKEREREREKYENE